MSTDFGSPCPLCFAINARLINEPFYALFKPGPSLYIWSSRKSSTLGARRLLYAGADGNRYFVDTPGYQLLAACLLRDSGGSRGVRHRVISLLRKSRSQDQYLHACCDLGVALIIVQGV